MCHRDDGEMTARGADTISWDSRGRMTGGTFAGTSLSYGFDPLGRRRTRTGAGVETRYLFAGGGEAALFETNAGGTIQLTDVDSPAGDLAQYAGAPITGSTVTYLYYNGHGDLAATADMTGTRTNAYTYDPFGAPKQSVASNSAVERWTGRWDKKLDTTSSLVQMGVRPYDPALGRFLAPDPVEGASWNAYDYSFQDPVNVYDLDGRVPCAPGIGCGAIGGAGAGSVEPIRRILSALLVEARRSGARVVINPGRSQLITSAHGGLRRASSHFYRIARHYNAPIQPIYQRGRQTGYMIDTGRGKVIFEPRSSTGDPVVEFHKLPRTRFSYYKVHYRP